MENTQNIKDLVQKFYPYAKNALGFEHPVTGKQMSFNTDVPQDMQKCIEKWRHYAKHQEN